MNNRTGGRGNSTRYPGCVEAESASFHRSQQLFKINSEMRTDVQGGNRAEFRLLKRDSDA